MFLLRHLDPVYVPAIRVPCLVQVRRVAIDQSLVTIESLYRFYSGLMKDLHLFETVNDLRQSLNGRPPGINVTRHSSPSAR